MMPKVRITGMDTFQKQFSRLADDIGKINSMALYDAAGVVADTLEQAMQQLPVHDDDQYGTAENKLYGATESEKAQLVKALGIAKFREDSGSKNTSIGFTGYVHTKSRKFNNQVPAGMLMQCIEYGTQFRKGTHTISNAIKAVKQKALDAAQKRIDQEVTKIME